jgi:glycosyltransferase involved in cell wall biosynthesis
MIDATGPQRPMCDVPPGFSLCVSRLLAYKNLDVLLEAFRTLSSEHLVVVGEGPDESRLRSLAPPNVTFLSRIDDAQLRWLYSSCRALLAAAFEDFGLTPIEAASFGKPTLALRFGGYLDTVIEGQTGLLFDEPEPAAVVDAMRRLDRLDLEPGIITAYADRFGEAAFRGRLFELVDRA